MKRDIELIRNMLLKIEENPDSEIDPIHLFKYLYPDFEGDYISHDAFFEHIYMLHEAKYIDVEIVRNMKMLTSGIRITFQGHEFISTIRNDTVWGKIKAKLGNEAIGFPFDIIKETGMYYLKNSLG